MFTGRCCSFHSTFWLHGCHGFSNYACAGCDSFLICKSFALLVCLLCHDNTKSCQEMGVFYLRILCVLHISWQFTFLELLPLHLRTEIFQFSENSWMVESGPLHIALREMNMPNVSMQLLGNHLCLVEHRAFEKRVR